MNPNDMKCSERVNSLGNAGIWNGITRPRVCTGVELSCLTNSLLAVTYIESEILESFSALTIDADENERIEQ